MDAMLSEPKRAPAAAVQGVSSDLLRARIPHSIASSGSDSKTAIELELISILKGSAFRSSARSSAFLRFVTSETLAGQEDLLKERTIGVALLKRDPAYDTGSDAVVRVRANDVRKRLSAHYERFGSKAGFRIELPPGSYVPKFVPEFSPDPPTTTVAIAPTARPMLLRQLSAPTVVALFLALIAIRVQVDGNDAFTRFWSSVLTGRDAIVVQLDAAPDGISISPALAEAATPLSTIASSFQVPFHMFAGSGVRRDPQEFLIRLSTVERPPQEKQSQRVGDATLYYGAGATLWLTGESAATLAKAVGILTTHDRFPDLRWGLLSSPPPSATENNEVTHPVRPGVSVR